MRQRAPRNLLWLLLLTGLLGAGAPARAQDGDFLSDAEVSAVRDAQEPDKRLVLYLDIAQSRLEAVRRAVGTRKAGAGKAVQKKLAEYVHVLEALDQTLQDAREKRVPLTKALLDVETRGTEFLKYLEVLDDESSFGHADYEFSLEEALDMTRDEIEEAKKGDFPEVKERKAPDLPARPPKPDPAPSGDEEGPPRKGQNQ